MWVVVKDDDGDNEDDLLFILEDVLGGLNSKPILEFLPRHGERHLDVKRCLSSNITRNNSLVCRDLYTAVVDICCWFLQSPWPVRLGIANHRPKMVADILQDPCLVCFQSEPRRRVDRPLILALMKRSR